MLKVMTWKYGAVDVPFWVQDYDSFQRWIHSDDYPEKLKSHFINGNVLVDFVEEAFSHNRVKTALTFTLEGVSRAGKLGMLFSDGMRFSYDDIRFSTIPDAIFVTADSLASGRVSFRAGKTRGAVATEMIGSPDLVVEVVSPSSVDWDTESMMTNYHDAGVSEYWVIDARDEDAPAFTIYRRTAKEFVAVRKSRGWLKSPVFGKSFRLTHTEQFGLTDYILEAR
jgi:Uma2 family endonuclease